MFLKVNGESVDINDGAKVSDLLDMFEIRKAKVAVERNEVYAIIFETRAKECQQKLCSEKRKNNISAKKST